MITYKNANGINVLVRFDLDRASYYRFNVREWEVGVRANEPFGWTREPDAIMRLRLRERGR